MEKNDLLENRQVNYSFCLTRKHYEQLLWLQKKYDANRSGVVRRLISEAYIREHRKFTSNPAEISSEVTLDNQ